jgi:hypothetical protein
LALQQQPLIGPFKGTYAPQWFIEKTKVMDRTNRNGAPHPREGGGFNMNDLNSLLFNELLDMVMLEQHPTHYALLR